MVLRASDGSAAYTISLKPHSLAVGRNEAFVVSWDLGGRLYSVYRDGATWRRGLGGQVLEKRGAGGVRSRRLLEAGEAGEVVDVAAALARDTLGAMAGSAWRWSGAVDGYVADLVSAHLRLSSRFDKAAAAADAVAFATVYQPIGILPPDQYLSLVVQATSGCAFNTCSFCALYHDGYRVKTPDEFADHVAAVRRYLGESASLRSRGVFLGAANALAVPMARLVPMFDTMAEALDSVRKGVYAFVDGFTGTLKTVSDYRLLENLGLRRVYVGLESGHDPLLALIRKPGRAQDAVDTVRAIKGGGVNVGVIVMTGLGGSRFETAHVEDTIRTLNAMPLGEGDLIYFSDLVEVPGTNYPLVAGAAGFGALPPDRRRAQQERIRAGLLFGSPGPRCSVYDIREFVW